jgi:pSer/pThr/pTyr-binding forkhead associated (FHA) protein
MQAVTAQPEDPEMPKLTLMFEEKKVKEVAVGEKPVGIGRSPDNDIPVDNLAVSNYHARVFADNGRLVVEDLQSLNGTFVNEMRIERATLHDGDSIHIGKHHIKVDASADTSAPYFSKPKPGSAPRIDETMVLDTKARRDMLQQAAALGERAQFSASRIKVPTLMVLGGKTDQKEYTLTSKLTVIGKSKLATVKMTGWFKPKMAAQINQRDEGYFLGAGEKVPSVNGAPITGQVLLKDGDKIAVSGVRLHFIFRD